jgi:hypothetical protein
MIFSDTAVTYSVSSSARMAYKKSPIADLPASVSCRKVQNSAGVTYWRVRVGKKFTGGSVLEKNFTSLGKAKDWIFGDIQRLKAHPGSLIEMKASAGAAAFSLISRLFNPFAIGDARLASFLAHFQKW